MKVYRLAQKKPDRRHSMNIFLNHLVNNISDARKFIHLLRCQKLDWLKAYNRNDSAQSESQSGEVRFSSSRSIIWVWRPVCNNQFKVLVWNSLWALCAHLPIASESFMTIAFVFSEIFNFYQRDREKKWKWQNSLLSVQKRAIFDSRMHNFRPISEKETVKGSPRHGHSTTLIIHW